jgi:hypothetical protein
MLQIDLYYWEACSHRKRRGLEARKKDMLPQDIKRAEERMFDRVAYERYKRERKEREELEQQVSKQLDVLCEQRGSSTCIKCGKDYQ